MALTRVGFVLRQFSRRLWVRAALFGVLGVAAAIGGRFIAPWLPHDILHLSGAQSVRGLLNILASSMLAVTTFSLSIMVQAYGAAAAAVTPRAVNLLLQDRTSQTVLSTFLGAFLFALVGLIALEAGAYGDPGRVVLFLATIGVTVAVVIAILRWISHLTTFGRLGDTTRRVEEAAQDALRERLARPCLGGVAAADGRPAGCVPVMAGSIGYLRHIDMPRLQSIASDMHDKGAASGPVLFVGCLPGSYLHTASPLVWLAQGAGTEGLEDRLRTAFTLGDERSFDQDPRFGLCVLTEIAERALSPAVNDPGTAIDVLGRVVRVLAEWPDQDVTTPEFPLVAVPPLRLEDMFDDVFPAIARDGAGIFAVQMRLQKALLALAEIAPATFAAAAADHSARALIDAEARLIHPGALERLRAASAAVAQVNGASEQQFRAI